MVNIPVKPKCDEEGRFERKCPVCDGYFRMKLGTGLPDQTECHCPYCNHLASHIKFWVRRERGFSPSAGEGDGAAGSGGSVRIPVSLRGKTEPIGEFPARKLEENLCCDNCSLDYSVYQAFAFCPDCGTHDSKQILSASFAVTRKILELAEGKPAATQSRLIEKALDDVVASFDGFGRRCFSQVDTNLSFHDIQSARNRIFESGKLDIASDISSRDWSFASNQFLLRHLITHEDGVIDASFAKKAGIPGESVGRRVQVPGEDVEKLMTILEKIAKSFPG